ncbi:MAG: aspartate-semialdehyde dehydrogenase [Syntrophomonadaceae bacterium]
MAQGINLAIVGATGAVGQEMLKILEERKFPVNDLILLADPREAGARIVFRGENFTVRGADAEAFKQADVALFAVNTEISQVLAPQAVENKCTVIDNSYAFRLDDRVPLVVPEVNPNDIDWHQGIIANPNCSTIIMVVAINPIHLAAGLKRVIVSTYQAVSGAGILGLKELEDHVRAWAAGETKTPQVFQHPIAFNVIPHIDTFMDEGYTREEMKMVWETRKIMHAQDLKISATTVRVPVFRSHSESITLELEKDLTPEQVKNILSQAPGVVVQDDPSQNIYPMPLYSSDTDEVYVGRIRRDISGEQGIVLWAAADQIRKGAATNAIQIAELVINKNLF